MSLDEKNRKRKSLEDPSTPNKKLLKETEKVSKHTVGFKIFL